MKVPDWIQQAGHFGMSGGAGLVVGLPMAWVGAPAFTAVIGAYLGAFVPWTVRELFVQWPISPGSDMRWDSLWYFVGGTLSAGICGALAEWVW